MYNINNQLCDVIRFPSSQGGTMGIVKARDKITEETKWYVGYGGGVDEMDDLKWIMAWGTKYTGDQIEMLKKRFEPYTSLKHLDYEAGDELDGKLSRCCDAKIINGLCSECRENI